MAVLRNWIRMATLLWVPYSAMAIEIKTPFLGETRLFSEAMEAFDEREAVLRISYALKCDEDPKKFHGITGEISFEGFLTRFELFEESKETSVFLGRVSAPVKGVSVKFDPAPNCQLTAPITIADRNQDYRNLSFRQRLAWQHSPYINIKEEQYRDRYTDLPLVSGYSYLMRVVAGRPLVILRYTVFFSDEDTMARPKDVQGQIARYGRAGDIEWAYEVGFEQDEFRQAERGEVGQQNLRVRHRAYQGTWAGGIGHWTYPFKGKLIGASEHVFLYNRATNNVFQDSPVGDNQTLHPVGYAQVPLAEIPRPEAREKILFDHPWTFAVTDRELIREQKWERPFYEYLYVLLSGKYRSKMVGEIQLSSGAKAVSGGGQSNIDRMGEDLWELRSYTGIPLSVEVLKELAEGKRAKFRLITPGGKPSDFVSDTAPRFYRFVSEEGKIVAQDISSSIDVIR
jgi:hypothetical protein